MPAAACAWRAAGHPPGDGPRKPTQTYAGTDRQVRGRLLDVLRSNAGPVQRAQLDVVEGPTPPSVTGLDELLVDGLVEQTADGRFALAGEGSEQWGSEGDDAGS